MRQLDTAFILKFTAQWISKVSTIKQLKRSKWLRTIVLLNITGLYIRERCQGMMDGMRAQFDLQLIKGSLFIPISSVHYARKYTTLHSLYFIYFFALFYTHFLFHSNVTSSLELNTSTVHIDTWLSLLTIRK